MIKFSLIIATINRAHILEKCLQNMKMQTYQNFETIIVDQSDNDEVQNLINRSVYSFEIKYIHIKEKGLSNARNIGIASASGDYFCLIDDDGLYEIDYLDEAVKAIRDKGSKSIISGAIWDNIENKFFVDYSKLPLSKQLSVRQIIRNCPSAALILPIKVYSEIGPFDKLLGAGAFFGAAEETDYLLRAYEYGYKIFFYPKIRLNHPIVDGEAYNVMTPEKAKSYSRGIGALYKKHMIINKKWIVFPVFVERAIKLWVKRIISNRYERELIKAQQVGTREGFLTYKIMDREML